MQHRIDKKFLILAGLLTSNTLFGFNYELEPKKVSDSVWCFFGKLQPPTKENGGFMSNSCYIKTKDSYVVVDSGPTYQFAQQSYKIMRKVSDLPISTVINTHEHDDHWQGNNYFKEKFNATLIGSELQQKSFKPGDKTRIQKVVSPDTYALTKIVPLDKIIKKDTFIIVGGRKIMIMALGYKAHSPDDLFVYLPDEKVLFSGDLVMNGRVTSNRDGSVLGQIKAHKELNQKPWKVLIPGHGYDTSKNAMKESEMYFNLIKDRVSKAIADDVEAGDISKRVTLPEFKDKAMYNELNKRNIFDAYSELEFAD